MKRNLIIILLALVFLSSCLSEDKINLDFDGIEPIELNDGHLIDIPDSVGVNSIMLEEIFKNIGNNENLWSIRSLLVIKDGKLVAERYYKNKDDITNQQMWWSCTKQVVGLLVGIAIDQNIIGSLDDPISLYLKEELKDHPDKKDITIGQLLKMESGIDYSNDGISGQTDKLLRMNPDDCIEFVLDLSMRSSPGTKFHYNDGDPLLLSAILQNATGMHTDEWANQVLFSKLGLKNYTWQRYKDGRTLGGFGIKSTPRNLAKIAMCVLDSGNWRNNSLVSKSWINEMTKVQTNTEWDFDFGYQWWIDPLRKIPFMWGHGGQFAFVIPEHNMVVVASSITNTQGDYQITADELLPEIDLIIKSIY